MHSNPIKNKLKRRQTPHQSQFTNQPSHTQKQNANNQNNLHIKPSSKQLSINVSSTKNIPLNLVNIHMESNSVLNKSYSIDVCGTQKCVMAVRKINQGLRVKVGGVQGRIKEMSQKKELLLEKYNKLVESQCKGLKMNCKKINLNNSTTHTNTLTNQNNPQPTTTKNQDINQWDSLLLFQNSQHHPSKPQDSRVKLSQIKQKVNELDLSSISKFAKEKPLTARTHRTSARQQ